VYVSQVPKKNKEKVTAAKGKKGREKGNVKEGNNPGGGKSASWATFSMKKISEGIPRTERGEKNGLAHPKRDMVRIVPPQER